MPAVRAELAAGRKRSHWMWFVFPQAAGLGFSAMAERYSIRSRAEARAYLARLLLGARLRECTWLVLEVKDRDAHAIFESPDDGARQILRRRGRRPYTEHRAGPGQLEPFCGPTRWQRRGPQTRLGGQPKLLYFDFAN